MTLLEKAKSYANGTRIISEWLGSGAEVVDKELAQKRADICITCPQNQRGGVVAKAVAWAIHEQVSLRNELKMALVGDSKLQQCQICLCQTKLKVWLPMSKIRAEETPESLAKYPDFCWMRTES